MIRTPRNFKPRLANSAQNTVQPLVKGGTRLETTYGFKVDGFKNKSFETQYHYLAPHVSTPWMSHPKKDRVVWVLTGMVYFIYEDADQGIVSQAHLPGEEIKILRGVKHRICTANQAAELHCCQQPAYDNALLILAHETPPVKVDLLEEPVELLPPTERAGSKAREQMLRIMAQKESHLTALSSNPRSGINAEPAEITDEMLYE